MSLKSLSFNFLSILLIFLLIKHHNLYKLSFELEKHLLTFSSQGRVTLSDDGSLTFNQTGVNLTNVGKTIPSCFPYNLPLFPGANIDLGLAVANEENCSLNLLTSSQPNEVANFYKTWLPRKGWSIDNLNQLKDQIYLTISNTKHQGSILISKKNKGSSIAIDLY